MDEKNTFETSNQSPERAVLVSLDTGEFDAETSIDELAELAKTAGAQVICKVIQKRDRPEKATYLGIGKLLEIAEFCQTMSIDTLIFDNELAPSQQRNIEQITSKKVIDRTTLILDIFALRAQTSEGRLQVELAQLKYSLTRLGGQGEKLSRLGGGIGTRGPGESKLETDKRHIRRRIQKIEAELVDVKKRREMTRKRREKNGALTVAIVGYTNAGKSTLLNALTDAGVLCENKLFATLDPTARQLTLPDGREIILIDTVGLIRRLPTKLVDAFRSTLEEACFADLILNVCDASDEKCNEHLAVTEELLHSLGLSDKPILTVMNKVDLTDIDVNDIVLGKTVLISAKNKLGLNKLLLKISQLLPKSRREAEFLIPFADGQKAAKIREQGKVLSEEWVESGLKIKANVPLSLYDELLKYVID